MPKDVTVTAVCHAIEVMSEEDVIHVTKTAMTRLAALTQDSDASTRDRILQQFGLNEPLTFALIQNTAIKTGDRLFSFLWEKAQTFQKELRKLKFIPPATKNPALPDPSTPDPERDNKESPPPS